MRVLNQNMRISEFRNDKDNLSRYNKYLNKVMLMNADSFITAKLKAHMKKTGELDPNKADFFQRMTLDIVQRN